jgi:hypothetical protein
VRASLALILVLSAPLSLANEPSVAEFAAGNERVYAGVDAWHPSIGHTRIDLSESCHDASADLAASTLSNDGDNLTVTLTLADFDASPECDVAGESPIHQCRPQAIAAGPVCFASDHEYTVKTTFATPIHNMTALNFDYRAQTREEWGWVNVETRGGLTGQYLGGAATRAGNTITWTVPVRSLVNHHTEGRFMLDLRGSHVAATGATTATYVRSTFTFLWSEDAGEGPELDIPSAAPTS